MSQNNQCQILFGASEYVGRERRRAGRISWKVSTLKMKMGEGEDHWPPMPDEGRTAYYSLPL